MTIFEKIYQDLDKIRFYSKLIQNHLKEDPEDFLKRIIINKDEEKAESFYQLYKKLQIDFENLEEYLQKNFDSIKENQLALEKEIGTQELSEYIANALKNKDIESLKAIKNILDTIRTETIKKEITSDKRIEIESIKRFIGENDSLIKEYKSEIEKKLNIKDLRLYLSEGLRDNNTDSLKKNKRSHRRS